MGSEDWLSGQHEWHSPDRDACIVVTEKSVFVHRKYTLKYFGGDVGAHMGSALSNSPRGNASLFFTCNFSGEEQLGAWRGGAVPSRRLWVFWGSPSF